MHPVPNLGTTHMLSRFGRVKGKQDNKEDLTMTKGKEHLKATAGTKIGGSKQRGPGLKLHSDYKPFGKANTSKANSQAKRSV